MPIPQGRDCYTLNHYHKNVVQQNLGDFFQGDLGRMRATHVWQLVPDVFSLDAGYENQGDGVIMPSGFEIPRDYVWQEHGYWHIGRSQVMFRKYAEREYYNNDMANQLKLNHMDMTFEPSWHCAPGEQKTGPRAIADPDPLLFAVGIGAGMGAPLGACRSEWAPALALEALDAPMPVLAVDRPVDDQHRRLLSIFSTASSKRPPQERRVELADLPDLHGADTSSMDTAGSLLPTPSEGLGAMLAQANKRRKKPPSEIVK